MLRRTYNAVEMYLSENGSEALDLARQMHSEDGSYEWTDAWDWDELCAMAAQGGKDEVDALVRAAVYGETYGGMVRYDGYGNLEPAEEDYLISDALDYLTDIMYGLEDYIDDDGYVGTITVSDELQEIINESTKVKVHITNIQYDISEEDELTPDDLAAMPTELTLTVTAYEDYISGEEDKVTIDEDEVADMISDETGWCILNYKYEIVEA